MGRISLAVATVSALLLGVVLVSSTGAVPAKIPAPQVAKQVTEPTESEMRTAFEGFLTSLVRGTLALIAETGGPDAVRTVKQNHNDQFEIHSFRKLGCTRSAGIMDYQCRFAVEVAVVSGKIDRVMTGRFVASKTGIVLAESM